MSLWVKICGNTSLEDALLAVEAGADAVGFVFASSPRRVTVEQVAAIVPELPQTIEKIGVFVEASFDEIANAVELCGLTGVQLHAASTDESTKLSAQLRSRFGSQLFIVRVVHFAADAASTVQQIALDSAIDAVLVDSRTATAVGGTGVSFDWVAARESIFSDADESPDFQEQSRASQKRLRLIAAGGLNPANVSEAIRMLHPWGVDAVSGVEATPSKKDAAKVRAFVAQARLAAGI